MQLRTIWPDDPIFIEVGVRDAELGLGLRDAGYSKYLGVSSNERGIARLQAANPDLADSLTFSKRRRLVLQNNADVLILSGAKMYYWWKFHAVRHAKSVSWRLGLNLWWFVGLVGCLFHAAHGRCSWPKMVSFRAPGGKTRWMFVSKILKPRLCHRASLHFIPHQIGLAGMFQRFHEQSVRYVVLRWFDDLPEIEPTQDVDMLVADNSLGDVFNILSALPGIQPCDVYSETGKARSGYRGVPYYPPHVARRILDGAVRHRNVCMVPNASDYFHSLAYHAVYHKGVRSGLPCKEVEIKAPAELGHDYAGILRGMAAELKIDVEVSMEGLHAYLQDHDWGPTPDLLGRLATACPDSPWLKILGKRLQSAIHDQGLAVFILRQEAVRLGFRDKMIEMIEKSGFEIIATKVLSPAEVKSATPRIRGGDWTSGDLASPGGPPAVAVVVYDRDPIPPNRKQRRKYPQRFNARIYVKDTIRDAIIAELPPDKGCNALHSSDHAAEAWHLIEELAPEMVEEIQARISEIHQAGSAKPQTTLRHGQSIQAPLSQRRAA